MSFSWVDRVDTALQARPPRPIVGFLIAGLYLCGAKQVRGKTLNLIGEKHAAA